MNDVVAIDPVARMLQGRANLVDEFEISYGRWPPAKARVRVFRRDGRTLVAFSGQGRDDHNVSRYIDTLATCVAARLSLNPATTFWLDHDMTSGSLAVFEADWESVDCIKNVRWKTFHRSEWHYFRGREYCTDLVLWLDDVAQMKIASAEPVLEIGDGT